MEKLKVLHLFNSYLPQTENWAYNLLRYTPDVEVHVFARKFLHNNFYYSSFKFVDNYLAGLHHLKFSFPEKTVWTYLKFAFIKFISLVLGTEKKILFTYIKKNKIDFIHAHFADVGWRYLYLAKELKIPYAVSFYGWDYEQLPYLKPRYKKYFKKMFEVASVIICEGPHGAETLIKTGCPSAKIKIVRLGVEVDKIPFFKRTKKPGELKLVQLATFNEKKGHIYSVMAFEQALKTCPDMHLTLAGGEGTEKGRVIEYITMKGLESKITVLDKVEWTQRFEFLKEFQVFIHPSCYASDMDCEGGAPIVLLDAQATGMPVIATTHCDIPMEVAFEKTGLLSPEKDVVTLSESIQRFYRMEQDGYLAFAMRAREWAGEVFEISRNALDAGTYYRQVTGKLI